MEMRIEMSEKEIKAYWRLSFWVNLLMACPKGAFFLMYAMIESKVDKIKAEFWRDIHAAHQIPLNEGIKIETKTMELVDYRHDIMPEPQKKTSRKKK